MTGAISRALILLVILHLVCSIVSAQTADELPGDGQALKDYTSGKYASAARKFEELVETYPASPHIHQWNLYRGISRYHLEQFPEATALFLKVLQSKSAGDIVSSAHLYLGNIAFRTGDESNAMHRYILAYSTGDGEVASTALKSIEFMLANGVQTEVHTADIINIVDAPKRCDIVTRIIRAATLTKQTEIAERLNGFCEKTAAVSKPQIKTSGGEATVAVLLPLSGELSDYGHELLQGVQIASRSIATGKRSITLEVVDSRSDPAEAARQLRLVAETDALAVIGPLTSEEAAATAAMAASLTIPVIVPAAAQSDFVSLSEFVYQLSPGDSYQGQKMGLYARNDLRADTALIIALNTSDQRKIADAFASQFRQLGGAVLATQYIHPRDKDFGAAIRDIKRLCGIHETDSLAYVDAAGDTLSSDAIPLELDCIFVCAQPEQLRLLLPQLHFYNIHGQLLGTDSWSNKDVINLDPDIMNGAVFPSASLTGSSNTVYEQFRVAYREQFGSEPTHLAALGFDACKLISESAATPNRKSIADKLVSISGYKGASGRITLTNNRRNNELPIYEIQSGKVKEKLVRITADDSEGR